MKLWQLPSWETHCEQLRTHQLTFTRVTEARGETSVFRLVTVTGRVAMEKARSSLLSQLQGALRGEKPPTGEKAQRNSSTSVLRPSATESTVEASTVR